MPVRALFPGLLRSAIGQFTGPHRSPLAIISYEDCWSRDNHRRSVGKNSEGAQQWRSQNFLVRMVPSVLPVGSVHGTMYSYALPSVPSLLIIARFIHLFSIPL